MARSFCRSAALALLLFPIAAHAHPIDELAQASYVGITPNAITIELDLIPGEEVGTAFEQEIQRESYPQNIGTALQLTLDGKPIPVQTVRAEKREIGQRLFFRTALPEMTVGAHQLQFKNAYAPYKRGYLASTLAENERVTIGEQRRDGLQQALTIDFQVSPAPGHHKTWLLVALPILIVLALLTQKRFAGQEKL